MAAEKTYNYLDFSQEVKNAIESGTYLRLINFTVEKQKDNKITKGENAVVIYTMEKSII